MDQIADHDVELFERHRVEVRPLFQRLPLHRRRDDRANGGNDDDQSKRAVDIQQRDHTGDQHQNAVRELQACDIVTVHQHLDLVVQRGDIVLPLLLLKFPGRHMDDMRHDLLFEAEQDAVSVFARAELPHRFKEHDPQNARNVEAKQRQRAVRARLDRVDGILEIDWFKRSADRQKNGRKNDDKNHSFFSYTDTSQICFPDMRTY